MARGVLIPDACVVPSSFMSMEPTRVSPAVALLRSKSEMMLDMAVSSTDLFAPTRPGDDFPIVFQSCFAPLFFRPLLLTLLISTGSSVELRPDGPPETTWMSLVKPWVENGRLARFALPMVNKRLEDWSSSKLTPFTISYYYVYLFPKRLVP